MRVKWANACLHGPDTCFLLLFSPFKPIARLGWQAPSLTRQPNRSQWLPENTQNPSCGDMACCGTPFNTENSFWSCTGILKVPLPLSRQDVSMLYLPSGGTGYVLCHSYCWTATTLKGSMKTGFEIKFQSEAQRLPMKCEHCMKNNNREWDMLKVLYMNLHSIKNPSSYNYHIFANIEILDVRLNIWVN